MLLELGYAAKHLGWQRVLCVANLAYGVREALPFDLRHRKVLPYCLNPGDEKAEARNQLVNEFKTQLAQLLSIPLESASSKVEVFFADGDTDLGASLSIEPRSSQALMLAPFLVMDLHKSRLLLVESP